MNTILIFRTREYHKQKIQLMNALKIRLESAEPEVLAIFIRLQINLNHYN